MYSQHGEEQRILKHFARRVGRFLDIGAYDGKTFSNTMALVEAGWSGVCVEPSPTVFPALLKLHGENPKIELVNALIGPTGFVTFWDATGDAVGSTDEAHVELWRDKGAKNFRAIWQYQVSPAELLAKFPGPYEFVNIDTEGTSVPVALGCYRAGLRPEMWCIEHDQRVGELTGNIRGYNMAANNGCNVFLVKH